MSQPNVSQSAKSRTKGSPKKPHKDFPLWFHKGSGQWAKTIRGKRHYFGTDALEAETRWDREKHDLQAGRVPPAELAGDDHLTVKWLCDAFMNSRESRFNAGKIQNRETINDYHEVVKRFAAEVGKETPLSSVRPALLENYANNLPSTWGVTSKNNHLRQLKSVLKFANDSDELPRDIKYKQALELFKERECEKQARHDAQFSVEELHQLLAEAKRRNLHQLLAAILLGVNCGYKTSDLAAVTFDDFDKDLKWLSMPRTKNGNIRLNYVWDETRDAVKAVMEHRSKPASPIYSSLIFLTRGGKPVQIDGKKNRPMTAAFRRLKVAAKIERPNVSQASCRHKCRTLADEVGDANATRRIMGHKIPGIEGRYIDSISHERIQRVCEHIHAAFYSGKGGAK